MKKVPSSIQQRVALAMALTDLLSRASCATTLLNKAWRAFSTRTGQIYVLLFSDPFSYNPPKKTVSSTENVKNPKREQFQASSIFSKNWLKDTEVQYSKSFSTLYIGKRLMCLIINSNRNKQMRGNVYALLPCADGPTSMELFPEAAYVILLVIFKYRFVCIYSNKFSL